MRNSGQTRHLFHALARSDWWMGQVGNTHRIDLHLQTHGAF